MKKYLVSSCLCCSLAFSVTVFANEAPQSYEEKISYTMGYEMGGYIRSLSGDIEEKALLAGVKAAFGGDKSALSPEQMAEVKQQFAKKMQEEQLKKIEEMKAKNLAEGQTFLEKNKAKKGVVVTDSGLQYEVLAKGDGPLATEKDIVTVNYKGMLIDGTEFDSTEKHGEPAQLQVDQVIPGWTEALTLMNPGSKLCLVIPPALAYGEQGAAPVIEPNSVLVFEVELLSIKANDSEQEDKQQQKQAAEADLSAKVEKAVEKVQQAAEKVHSTAEGQ